MPSRRLFSLSLCHSNIYTHHHRPLLAYYIRPIRDFFIHSHSMKRPDIIIFKASVVFALIVSLLAVNDEGFSLGQLPCVAAAAAVSGQSSTSTITVLPIATTSPLLKRRSRRHRPSSKSLDDSASSSSLVELLVLEQQPPRGGGGGGGAVQKRPQKSSPTTTSTTTTTTPSFYWAVFHNWMYFLSLGFNLINVPFMIRSIVDGNNNSKNSGSGPSPAAIALSGKVESVDKFLTFLGVGFLSALSDKFGRKPLMAWSALGFMLTNIIQAQTKNSVALLYLADVVDGCSSCMLPLCQAYVTDCSLPSQRAANLGIFQGLSGTCEA
jgi:Major Facilitator Superfamily